MKYLTDNIRIATTEDADRIAEIYAPYVIKTPFTFEYTPPSAEEMRRRMEEIQQKYPWLVYEENGEILGYAYGGPDHTRDAYRWTVEDSVYVAEEATGRGIGKKLLGELLKLLQKQGFCICYALIVEGNAPSLKMHDKFEFYRCGFAKNAGFKLGGWHSVVTLEKQLNDFALPPPEVTPFPNLCSAEQ